MEPLSVVLITYNEEQAIGRCLKSVQSLADEILVVDSFSTDRTVAICKEYNARVIQHPFEGFGPQKRFATTQASYDFILFLDADEELSETLRESILQIKTHYTENAYTFNRLNFYCNKPIRHCGWYPDKQLRLFRRSCYNWNQNMVHETISVPKATRLSHLKGDLNHYTCQKIEDHQLKEKRYAMLNAASLAQNNRKITHLTPMLKGGFRFIKTYLFKGGFLDGRYGFFICTTLAKSSFLKYSIALKIRNASR